MRGWRAAAATLVLVLALGTAGCLGDDASKNDPRLNDPNVLDPRTQEPPGDEPLEVPTDPAVDEPLDAAEPLAGSYTDAFALTLPTGWTLRDCLGERPTMCVWDGATLLGDIELAEGYPLDPHEDGLTDAALLTGRAVSFLDHFRADRSQGCQGFTFEADEVTDATVGGVPAVRTGFTLWSADGVVVERVVSHYLVRDGLVALVSTDAYAAEGGCLPPSDGDDSFAPHDLLRFEPVLDRVVADTPLPS
jgi:hypothetical protein